MDLVERVERYFARQQAWLEQYAHAIAALAQAADEEVVSVFLAQQPRRERELADFLIEQRGLLHEWGRSNVPEASRATIRGLAAAAAARSEAIETRLAELIAHLEAAKRAPEAMLQELRRARAAFGRYQPPEASSGGQIDEEA